ncbi:hypothetical protein C8J57DRAFT_1572590 [Mycena rebaudengoi]|nr:hypothetical protein C8J57DRAFT_1572590 [Mycena rebaudengoi]
MCGGSYTLIPHHNLNLKQARQLPALRPIMTRSGISFSGWFFLPPTETETDVVLVHLRLELPITPTMSAISSPGPVPLAFPRPASPTKSPTTSRFRDNTTNNNNTTNVNSSPTLQSHTSSLFDSPAGGSPHRSTPSIDDLKPNAHPYPIRTTSTAFLTRSNSTSSQQQNGGRHHYVPPPGGGNDAGSTGKAAGERKGEYRGHRYSRSLSSSEGMAYGGVAAESPGALPVPPRLNTTPDNKTIDNVTPQKRWTSAPLTAYLGGEAGVWAAVHMYK